MPGGAHGANLGHSAQHGGRAGHSFSEAVDFLDRVVGPKRRPDRSRNPELVHERLRAVVAGPHRDAELVEERAEVVRVHAVDQEGHHARLARGGADEPHPVNGF